MVHIVSILNITRYAVQVNRQHINITIDTVDNAVYDVNKPMASSVIFMNHFSHSPTLHLVSQPYMPKAQLPFLPDVHYKLGKLKVSVYPHKLPQMTSAPSTVTTAITLICPGEPMKFITVKKPMHILWLPPACSATSPHFHVPPWSEHSELAVNISLDMANLNMVNISSLDICIWQHLKDHRNETPLHHLSSIPLVPIAQLYKHMISGNTHMTPFTSPTESTVDTESIWTLFSHTGVYVMVIGSLIPIGLGIFCFYFFWCWPASLAHWPLQPGSTWYTIVDDDVEIEPIYRCNGKAKQPAKPCENHDLCMEWKPTWTESQQKQQMQSLGDPACRSLDKSSKIQGTE